HPTIQAAIDAAADGDTIVVGAGIYREAITWTDKSLILQGAGPGQSVIDPSVANGGPGGRCMTVGNVPSTARIEGFTFQNGYINTGGGLGGGMYNASASPSVFHCAFSGNSATSGAGMYNDSSSNPIVTNCVFSGNGAYIGGGIYNDSASP